MCRHSLTVTAAAVSLNNSSSYKANVSCVWYQHRRVEFADWTDFWGTIVNYKDGAAPSTNRRLHRHLLQVEQAFSRCTVKFGRVVHNELNEPGVTYSFLIQSTVTTVTATANASASAMSNDWGDVMGTLLSSNWSKLAPAAVQNFGMLLQIVSHHTTHPP